MMNNIDNIRDKQLHEYLDGKDRDLSNCCGPFFIEETDICSECGEHAETVADAYFDAMEERADDERSEGKL